VRLAVALIVLALLAAAVMSSHQHRPFFLLIDEAEAATIVCNPSPTPYLIGWHRNRKGEKA
jgi:hypothetical protein